MDNIMRNILIVTLLAFMTLLGRLAYLQLVHEELISQTDYRDAGLEDAIHDAIARETLVAKGGKIVLKSTEMSPQVARAVQKYIQDGFIYARADRIEVAAGSFSVGNPRRRLEEEFTLRGQILDRTGMVLASSQYENGRQTRSYSDPALWYHTVGYIHPIFGKEGLEASADGYLKGSGRSFLREAFEVWRIQHRGDDVVTTLDSRLQEAAQRALGNMRGAIIVLVPKTGEILACVSSPTFDPHVDVARWNVASRQGRDSRMLNRAFQRTSPPGSTFKMLVAAAALDSGCVTLDESFECNGYFKPFRNARYAMHDFEWLKKPRWGGHNPDQNEEWTIREAFAKSCNVTFAQIGLKLGPELLLEYAKRFGFYTDIPLIVGDREEIGLISRTVLCNSLADAPNIDQSKFGRAQLAQTAVGQYETRTTLLQMALVGAAIANDGAMMKPMLVRETRAPTGRAVSKIKPELFLRPVSVSTARIVAEMMEQVVVRGTGHEAGLNGIRVAGKTGTAQVRRGAPPNAWFVGFAPVEEPRAVVAVVLENAGTGGSVAAPVAKQVLQAALLAEQSTDIAGDERDDGISHAG